MPEFSATLVSSVLGRSHNLIIQGVIFTRHVWIAMNDEFEHERARVLMGMQGIAPHMHRCRSITFNVRFSSSLPSFPNDFHGNAEYLESLALSCLEDDGGAISTLSETNMPPVHREPFQCPNLRTLAIDGRNYFNACQQSVNWTEMFPVISALSISHFTPVAIRSDSFTSSELMLSLVPIQNYLTFFGIDDVQLDDSPTPVLDDDDELIFLKLKTIVLQNMLNPHCMGQILEFLREPSDVHISRCRLGPQLPCEGTLSLNEIDMGEDLVGFLADCLADNLVINGCPGFGDEVLNAMMTPESVPDRWHPGLSRCAPYIQDLSIRNCLDFSISALKQLVEWRRIQPTCSPKDIFSTPPPHIKALRLSGRLPYLSPEDREWFKGCVSEFSYGPIQ
jgi:hypothetical protein